MEINETAVLDDRGFIQINGNEAKDFLQNIITNDIDKAKDNFALFSSIFTPQGKYLYEFFILKIEEGFLLECEKESAQEIIKIFNFYKLRSKVNLVDVSNKYTSLIISLEKFKKINTAQDLKFYSIIFLDSRNENLGAKIILKKENVQDAIKNLDLNTINKQKYYSKSFHLGIPQINLFKLKDKIFGIENNLDELNGIDFKKGCYIGQENTSRIKLRNKLRRRILPIIKIAGEIYENDKIKYKDSEIGKVMIDKPYPFALIKVVEPSLEEFVNVELVCGQSKIKIFKPKWIT
tara:strand:- start:840 stop:1715 length:876 start_codon:yes stop_codon:yes gene_type:complete